MATATLTITINATQTIIDDIVDTVSHDWDEDTENLGFDYNGDTKAEFVEKMIINHMKRIYRSRKQQLNAVDLTDFDASVS